MIIILSKHAKDKIVLLGITKEQIKNVIIRGSKFKQTDGYLVVYNYINVACKKLGQDTYYIKTVYVN